MAQIVRKSASKPEESREFPNGNIALLNVGGADVGLATFEPGWRWSEDVKPLAGTDHCDAAHMGYTVSGKLIVQMADGDETEISAGDFFAIPAGHDAWVVGDEPCVMVDWQGMADYAKQ